MPGCILRVSGDDFRVDDFLAGSNLRPYRVHRRGDIHRSQCRTESSFCLKVSAAGDDLNTQIVEALEFLTVQEAELRRLQDFLDATDRRLDFGYYRRDAAAIYSYLPPELLTRAGRLGIGIELSVYATSEPEATSRSADL